MTNYVSSDLTFAPVQLGGGNTVASAPNAGTTSPSQGSQGTSATGAGASSGGGVSDYISALLSAIMAPNTPITQQMANAWIACETADTSNPAAPYNYLNYENVGGGFASYSSASAAGTAAGQRLVGPGYSAYGYNQIVNAFQQQNPSALVNASGLSVWGTDPSCVAGVLGV